jgi:histidinol-phosphate/aromatic aminotransferase/cobyric acid decarboxylase-like protein
MAREELVDVYERRGMKPTGEDALVSNVRYVAVRGKPEDPGTDAIWALPFSDRAEAPCFHGGASLAATRRSDIISADVLDAWYDPSLAAQAAAARDSAWAMRTSAPTNAEPLIAAIAESRGVACENIAVGAGSSELIFRCFVGWLTKASRVLLVEPTYGEYSHVLRNVIGCTVDSLELHESEGFALNANRLWDRCAGTRYDLVVLVNPNSPFGTHCPGLKNVLPHVGTRVWVDETYVDYVGGSLECVAADSPNLIVCKSMSKVYALSGCRVGYVCGHPSQIGILRARTPPWIVGRSTQAAAIEAVRDVEYYADRIRDTHAMRESLERQLGKIPGVRVFPGCANWTLVKLPADVGEVVRRCAERGVCLRVAGLGRVEQPHLLFDRVEQVFDLVRRHRRHLLVEPHLDPPHLGGRVDGLRREPTAELRDRPLPRGAVHDVGLAGQIALGSGRHRVGGSRRPDVHAEGEAGAGHGQPLPSEDGHASHRQLSSLCRIVHGAVLPFLRTHVARVGRPASSPRAERTTRHAMRSFPSKV